MAPKNIEYRPDMCKNYDDKIECLKKEFADIYDQDTNSVRYGKSLLIHHIGEFENKWDKDICDFNENEVIALCEKYQWTKPRIFVKVKKIVKPYIKFQRKKHGWLKDVKHPFEYLDSADLPQTSLLSTSYFRDFEDFYTFLSTIYDPSITLRDDKRYLSSKVALCLTFYDLTDEMISEVRVDGINIAHQTISCTYGEDETFVAHNIDLRVLQDCFVLALMDSVTADQRLIRIAKSSSNAGWNFRRRGVVVDEIRAFVKKLPSDSPYAAKDFTFRDVRQLGRCCTLLDYERTHGRIYNTEMPNVMRMIGDICYNEPQGMRNIKAFYQFYTEWKAYYYPEFSE